jgi:hypothetical protein
MQHTSTGTYTHAPGGWPALQRNALYGPLNVWAAEMGGAEANKDVHNADTAAAASA